MLQRIQAKLKKILILHGPNLNLLGERQTDIYGTLTLSQINQALKEATKGRGLTLRFFQKNGEGQLIDLLQKYRHWADGIVFNPGAYTHSSYALRDAILSLPCPTVEVHLSDLRKRAQNEPFRGLSVTAPACKIQIMGFGWKSYLKGIEFLLKDATFQK